MNEDLVKRLRDISNSDIKSNYIGLTMMQAADAIEERDRYALTIQHEMMAEAESHMAQVERLNKQIEELSERVEELEAAQEISPEAQHFVDTKADSIIDGLQDLLASVKERPRWVPVTERLPESVDDDVLVTDGEGYAVGYWRPDAQAWDSTDFGWLENRSEPPCGIHTVTHWMPLPPLPEQTKEEA